MKKILIAVIIALAITGATSEPKKLTYYAGAEYELQPNYFVDFGCVGIRNETNLYGGWLALHITPNTNIPLKIKLNQTIVMNKDVVIPITSIRTQWSFKWNPHIR
jgi:hypothetical protein